MTEESLKAAAELLNNADFLLIMAGAGMSADSGIPIFATASQSYEHLNLSYDQVACVDMLKKNPRLFYGFWSNSLKKYTSTDAHEGYEILSKWQKRISEKHEGLRLSMAEAVKGTINPLESSSANVFVSTTNVDGWFPRTFRNVQETHGNIHSWQCSGVPQVVTKAMWLNKMQPCSPSLFEPPAVPFAGEVESNTLELLQAVPLPLCPKCQALLRPNIFLFGDGRAFVETRTNTDLYQSWVSDVRQRLAENAALSLVVLEVGCGLRVPSLRKKGEEILRDFGQQASLIRINPEYELNPLVCPPTVSIKASGLETLQKLDHIIMELDSASAGPS
mmetsp:Transcript_63100/g.131162  ORF Transcript_63100/g.131162 Transcript_63100/m.131162 type:complete len:333 (+) Transcript_63100:111-1109(+)|eukprot:CAMPEP_0181323932 /NCGR_PEP_ID=MMETSP1101-20121128/20068_1 /TAXON_ID=46948 /ORGANISM="Rhodomonas abbreviata, Strain Caron Lab Isolate" /LENGTH=332 /DNA_ID=CAMNT_0023432031 /DNA_START=95 /DNA_END=1093 /DNA_ORIENTATION=+